MQCSANVRFATRSFTRADITSSPSKTTSPRSKKRLPPIFRRLFPPANERQRVAHLDRTETVGKEHGRVVRRELEVSTRWAGCVDWPGLQQACRLTRTHRRVGPTEVR